MSNFYQRMKQIL